MVRGYPGSEVYADRIVLTAKGRLTRELEAAVQAVVDLATALNQTPEIRDPNRPLNG